MTLTALPVHAKLLRHADQIRSVHMRELFKHDNQRHCHFSLQAPHIFIDYSKNRITDETLGYFGELAQQAKLSEQIQALFTGSAYQGEPLNNTEQRPALHTALRRPLSDRSDDIYLGKENISEQIRACHAKMDAFLNQVHSRQYLGAKGLPIDTLVSIGIGGSFLGPKTVTNALEAFSLKGFKCYYVANIDSTDLYQTFSSIDPARTLFLIQSKSFTTLETLENAKAVNQYLSDLGFSDTDISRHLAAVTSHESAALALGIDPERIFPMWDWVGGRYSLWSAIGFPIAFQIGMSNFSALLAGAHDMDRHFYHAPFDQNAPVLLALIGLWYHNYFSATTHAILPYDQRLITFPDHLQQLDMESNGKHVSRTGEVLTYTTGPIIWGGIGCNGQHAYHQLLHQGSHLIPADFIVCVHNAHPLAQHQAHLFSNCLSQSRALMSGKTRQEAHDELIMQGFSEAEATRLAPHKENNGNQPSNTLVMHNLTPEALGALIALYEHKTFVQSAMWDINPFDQWGVELGKVLGKEVFQAMQSNIMPEGADSSTCGLLDIYRKLL
jgi:glucose-6-phosphate isomerase